jgi:hypothetical protein
LLFYCGSGKRKESLQGEKPMLLKRLAFLMLISYISAQGQALLNIQPGLIVANGTWVDDSNEVHNRVVEIHCSKASRKCEWASASVVNGLASLETGQFHILKWDREEIAATERGFPPLGCNTATLSVNLRSETVSLVTVLSSDKSCASVAGGPRSTYSLRPTRMPGLADRCANLEPCAP